MTEVVVLGFIVAGFLIMVGATFTGKRVLALTLAAALVGFSFEPLLMKTSPELMASVPLWVRVAGVAIVGLWILQALFAFLFGWKVANSAIGNILAQAIVAITLAGAWPFRWLRRALDFSNRGGSG